MLKKTLKALLCVALVFTLLSATCTNAFAASLLKKEYIKEMYVSYGKTADEAKKYLTDNGYEVLDSDLNEGADDIISSKRAVYLGYKTTEKADEAITDIKLMNMKGGYSIQDYQMLLSEQKENIKVFLEDFIVAVNEYRSNYNKKQERAIAAHDMLNLLYDDDTEQYVGDLLLNKIKEEYTDEQWNALSAEEQKKTADMTTILMQGNSDSILIIEQIIALAADDSDTLWVERYESAKTYDEMVESLMNSEKITLAEATKRLAAEYDDDAKALASKFADYKSYLDENYVNTGITLTSTDAERETYEKDKDDFDSANWFVAGTQYELLATLKNDDISLLDLVSGIDYDITGEDRYLLYPLLSVLTKGQRACFDFLSMYQLVACGINGDESMQQAIDSLDLTSLKEKKISVYDGIDRTIFTGDVALTNDALRLQASSGKNALSDITDSISNTSFVLLCVCGISFIATTLSWQLGSGRLDKLADLMLANRADAIKKANDYAVKAKRATNYMQKAKLEDLRYKYNNQANSLFDSAGTARVWGKIMHYARYVTTAIFFVLMLYTAWSTVNDIIDYYNADLTPIPQYMVNQSTNDKDEKVYTYYNAVKCNRVASGLVTDNNKLLGEFGDLNGDVGKQWVALYTTKDKAAGDPVTTDFVVQYNNTKIPEDKAPLSMFGESVAQNLTNKKMGYTYSDGKNGIYLFYGTDSSIFAGSTFTNGIYALYAAGAVAIIAVATVLIRKSVKKKNNKEVNANA